MKYIRTENGVYEVSYEHNYYYETTYSKECCPAKNEVIKVADNIPELCDRFVFEYKKYDENGQIVCRFWRDYLFMEVALETFNDCKIKDKVIYGAIITDKGLIYVAKMNKEGEFELI